MSISFRYNNKKPEAPEPELEPSTSEPIEQEPDLAADELNLASEDGDLPEEDPSPFVLNEKIETEKGLGRFLEFVKAHMRQKREPNSALNQKNIKGVKAYNRVKNPNEETQKGLQLKKSA